MNYIYVGLPADLNIGNGKTSTIVGETIEDWLAAREQGKETIIYSNIKLKNLPEGAWKEFRPDNIEEVLEAQDALVILDELHAIVHKKHTVSESCTKHVVKGLCYRLSEFFRQVRKRDITTRSSCQTFNDAQYQYRTLMQQQIVCELHHLVGNRLYKCDPAMYPDKKCPADHYHIVRRYLYRNGCMFVKELKPFDINPYFQFYNTEDIVTGWVTYD